MIVAGEREHNQTTLEITTDPGDGESFVILSRWRDRVGGGVYCRDSMALPITDDPVRREKLVRDFAAALGVPFTGEERRRAREAAEREKRQQSRLDAIDEQGECLSGIFAPAADAAGGCKCCGRKLDADELQEARRLEQARAERQAQA